MEHSDQYELLVYGIKDERDLSRQVALVDEMISIDVDAIVMAPSVSRALVPALRPAIHAGIVVVNIDNRLVREILEHEGIQIPLVGPYNKADAQKVAEHLMPQLQKGGKCAF